MPTGPELRQFRLRKSLLHPYRAAATPKFHVREALTPSVSLTCVRLTLQCRAARRREQSLLRTPAQEAAAASALT